MTSKFDMVLKCAECYRDLHWTQECQNMMTIIPCECTTIKRVTEIAAKNDTIRELEKRLDESARMTLERIKLLISLNWKPENKV